MEVSIGEIKLLRSAGYMCLSSGDHADLNSASEFTEALKLRLKRQENDDAQNSCFSGVNHKTFLFGARNVSRGSRNVVPEMIADFVETTHL